MPRLLVNVQLWFLERETGERSLVSHFVSKLNFEASKALCGVESIRNFRTQRATSSSSPGRSSGRGLSKILNIGNAGGIRVRKFFRFAPAKVYGRVRALETARTGAFSFELVGYANGAREQQRQAQLEIELSSTRQVIWRLYNVARARDAKTIKSETW